LIVDDEAANRLIMRYALEQAGLTVVEAADGNEAIARAREVQPSLIAMDIDMPGCNGFEATQAIRASGPPLSSVPILVYSATKLSDAEIAQRGMDGRIAKPFVSEQLLDAIGPWLKDGQMAGAERLAGTFGAEQLATLVRGLREQLVAAIAEMDAVPIPSIAHRIAGVAGTLGFADVSASWLALSEGDESARDRARRDARIAVAAIDRSELVAPHH
jgi:CheY-like chemotaxis protein